METKKRAFRTQASYAAERKSWSEIIPFLESQGFVDVGECPKTGNGKARFVRAIDPDGKQLKMHIKLCWRRSGGEGKPYSAAQFPKNRINTDWETKLRSIVQSYNKINVTHTLIVQRGDDDIETAALIPAEALSQIWEGQHKVCEKLIEEKKLGGITKNITENGQHPTIYLLDTRAPSSYQITDVLWNWPGVRELRKLPIVPTGRGDGLDDTYQDLDIDTSLLGNDGQPRFVSEKSGVKRNLAVRRAVIQRATNGCERASCPDNRHYSGFLDVHHILGADKSDRVWTCVALCPNCHRAAHYGPDCDTLNKELLDFASQFRLTPQT